MEIDSCTSNGLKLLHIADTCIILGPTHASPAAHNSLLGEQLQDMLAHCSACGATIAWPQQTQHNHKTASFEPAKLMAAT